MNANERTLDTLGTKKAHPREDGPAVFSVTWTGEALRLPSSRTPDRDPLGRDHDVRADAAVSYSPFCNGSVDGVYGQGTSVPVTLWRTQTAESREPLALPSICQ